jgi:hypothetical protein
MLRSCGFPDDHPRVIDHDPRFVFSDPRVVLADPRVVSPSWGSGC